MIETTKKILQKLINNLEKYQVRCIKYTTTYSFDYTWENYKYSIVIGDEGVCLYSKHSTLSEVFTDEGDKYEILGLRQKLAKACEDLALSKFEGFLVDRVEVSEINSIDDIE